ncbi:MAG: hypothetical protein JNN01_20500 [Opitutaceae bacterium]|nr:hypothetical protein [Opitutaceae bacterium]
MRFTHTIAAVSVLLAVGASLNGCRDRNVVVYQAPKDRVTPPPATPEPAAAATLPDGHPPLAGGAAPAAPGAMGAGSPLPQVATGLALRWKAPSHWTAKPPGGVRKGSYAVPGTGGEADMAITAFPGDTGGLVANVNRWRAQVGLEPQSQAQIESAIEQVEVGSLHIDIVDVTGKGPGGAMRLLGAIVPHQGQTWFFKMLGPEPVVAAERAGFKAFLSTIEVP